jgi:hypothetical protein
MQAVIVRVVVRWRGRVKCAKRRLTQIRRFSEKKIPQRCSSQFVVRALALTHVGRAEALTTNNTRDFQKRKYHRDAAVSL